jgi:glycosyltransferase involved in cell wall biosynthesis
LQPGWHRWAARRLYPRCDAVVTPSGGSRRSLQRVTPLTEEKLYVIPNPVDPEDVRAKASQPLSSAHQALLRKPYILGAGWLRVAHKGFDLLVRAHAEVRSRGIDHNLVILGEDEDRELLQQMARSLGVADSVFLPGFQRNPFPFFRAAAALAAPARLDSFGRIYLEAMALGLPVIGSTASGPMEILDSGKYGIVVPSEDVGALSDAMCALLGDAGTRERYSQLALARANAFCPRAVAARWDELLCTLAMRK